MIRSINRFFSKNSRWLFGIFTVIIIVAFMDFLSPGTFGGCAMSQDNNVGTVFGDKVTYSDLRTVMTDMEIVMALQFGGMNRDLPVENAFYIYAQIEAAKRRGIVVSDREIADYIIKLPRFSTNGKFDAKLYDAFVKSMTERGGITADDIDNAIRNFLLINKLGAEIEAAVVVTDNELENFYKIYNEKIYLKRLVFNVDSYLPKAKLTDAELQEYFKNNSANYKIPARTKALVACFEYDAPELKKEADKSITEKAMKEYYENNKTRFSVNSDKGSVITPYNKAKDLVRIYLRDDIIKKLALQKAQIFARDVYDSAAESVADCRRIFSENASKNKVKVIEVPYFKAGDNKVGSIESANLVREIIATAADVPVSNAVAGEKGVYVGHAVAFEAERPAKIDEVKKDVTDDCRKNKARQLAIEECEKLIASLSVLEPAKLSAKVKADIRFKDVAPFSMETQHKEAVDMITRQYTYNLKQGELSKLMFVPDGVGVAYVVKRELGTLKDFEAKKAMISSVYRNIKAQSAMRDFETYLNSQCVLKIQK